MLVLHSPCFPGSQVWELIGTSQYDDLYFLLYPQAVAAKLDLPDDLIGYFSLFLVREKEDGAFSCEFFCTLLLSCASSSEFASFSPLVFPQGFPLDFPPLESHDIFLFYL